MPGSRELTLRQSQSDTPYLRFGWCSISKILYDYDSNWEYLKMNEKTAIQIAKSGASTPEQLKGLLHISDAVSLLLARNPNTTAGILQELGASVNSVIAAAVTAHPNIPVELLEKLGAIHPREMFRNPALPKIMASKRNFLRSFGGDAFEDALKSTNLPKCAVDWLASHGKTLHQAIFLFGAERDPETIAQFRKSKHAKVVKQLLEKDDATYLAWAQGLGFVPAQSKLKNSEPFDLKNEIDDWVERLWTHNGVLWKSLVPENGDAPTLQGELVRALGRIESEYFRNGMMNWGDGSHYYENLTQLIHATLKTEKTFSKLVQKVIDGDIGEIKLSGKSSGIAFFGGNALLQSDVERSHQRLGALITIWCQRHPEPVPYVDNRLI